MSGKPAAQPEAHVAPNAPKNTLRPAVTLHGVLLWPALRAPTAETPKDARGLTGTLPDHWHYRPGKLDHASSTPTWKSPGESFTPARYAYDRRYAGDPLPRLDVDLFTADAEADLGDHGKVEAFYRDLAACPPGDPGEKVRKTKLFSARLASTVTDAAGRFSFGGLRAGEYLLFLRGRLSFVEIEAAGGVVASPRAAQHNGVKTAALSAWGHRPFVKVVIGANGSIQLRGRNRQGGDAPFATDRLLDQGKTIADVDDRTPYRFYALPLLVKSNTDRVSACVRELAHAFDATEDHARKAMDATAILDLSALERWECAATHPKADAILGNPDAVDALLKRTLLLGGADADQRSMAYDHAYWAFLSAEDTGKKRGRFVPLGAAGFFSGKSLYGHANKSKDSYGRFALRYVDPPLQGRDVRELKTRIVLWGSDDGFVDMHNDRFDAAVRDALVRWKRDQELYRLRVGAPGAIDDAASVITAIVDAETFERLDAVQPSVHLGDVASKAEAPNNDAGLLSEKGYERLLFYAAENALRRIAPDRSIKLHSCIRTLAHNRQVYTTGAHQLTWFLASDAPERTFEYAGFKTVLRGELGSDGKPHKAGASAKLDMRYDLPRGTYRGEPGATMAADYSKHTTGQAIDFDLDRAGTAGQKETAVQWDTNAMLLFGAHRHPPQPASHGKGRLWLEPHKDANHPTWTTTWTHIDTSALPDARADFVLTQADAIGPRWDATVIVSGQVMQAKAPRLGARVDLVQGAQVLATTYADRDGNYSLRLRRPAGAGEYEVRAQFAPPYPFQPPVPAGAPPAAPPETRTAQVTVAWPGDENRGVDFVLPPATLHLQVRVVDRQDQKRGVPDLDATLKLPGKSGKQPERTNDRGDLRLDLANLGSDVVTMSRLTSTARPGHDEPDIEYLGPGETVDFRAGLPGEIANIYPVPDKRRVVEEVAAACQLVRRARWGARPPAYSKLSDDWDFDTIVLHHSGHAHSGPKEVETEHLSQSYDDIAYHYVVGRDGRVYEGRYLTKESAATARVNTGKLGIVLLGNFMAAIADRHAIAESLDVRSPIRSGRELCNTVMAAFTETDPTPAQLAAVGILVKALKKALPSILYLGGHRDFKTSTVCPGGRLYSMLEGIRVEAQLQAPG